MKALVTYIAVIFSLSGCASGGSSVSSLVSSAEVDRPIIEVVGTEDGIVIPPKGFNDFCRRHAEYCADFASAQSMQVTLTRDLMEQIDRTNRRANGSILPLDEGTVNDHWKFPTVTGDCEDYCLLKQRELAEAGIPMGAMPIAAVRSPEGEWHAVLLVQTDRGTLVLDNIRNEMLFHDQTDYEFAFIQRPDDMMRWARVASDEILLTALQ